MERLGAWLSLQLAASSPATLSAFGGAARCLRAGQLSALGDALGTAGAFYGARIVTRHVTSRHGDWPKPLADAPWPWAAPGPKRPNGGIRLERSRAAFGGAARRHRTGPSQVLHRHPWTAGLRIGLAYLGADVMPAHPFPLSIRSRHASVRHFQHRQCPHAAKRLRWSDPDPWVGSCLAAYM